MRIYFYCGCIVVPALVVVVVVTVIRIHEVEVEFYAKKSTRIPSSNTGITVTDKAHIAGLGVSKLFTTVCSPPAPKFDFESPSLLFGLVV